MHEMFDTEELVMSEDKKKKCYYLSGVDNDYCNHIDHESIYCDSVTNPETCSLRRVET